jgi:glucose-6-phosphate isomerase
MNPLTDSEAWRALRAHAQTVGTIHLREWFAHDPERSHRYAQEAAGLLMDWSRHRVDDRALELLQALAAARDLPTWIDRLFAGDPINTSEQRAALHTALRADPRAPLAPAAAAAAAQAARVLARVASFASAVREGRERGHAGHRFTDVLSLGIGGSDLGPAMVTTALADPADARLRVHPVSNIDPSDLGDAMRGLDPATTLVVVGSKSFTTLETLANARRAREWITAAVGQDAVARHFAAATGDVAAAATFGVATHRVFDVPDWVGGRYSLWSAIGLPAMLAIGPDRFERLLAGARAMDRHFREAPAERNLPVIAALLGVWCTNFLGASTHAVIPYDQRLRRLPAHLQQLEMESNGKSVDRDGQPLACASAPIVWGSTGTDGQHAYFQLLHQGTVLVPCDLLVMREAAAAGEAEDTAHRLLIANCLAQADALALGSDPAQTVVHRRCHGNQPCTVIAGERLDPETLGALLALYEHKVFVQSVVWGLNPFDQWGVELGKTLAHALAGRLAGPPAAGEPPLLQRLRPRPPGR